MEECRWKAFESRVLRRTLVTKGEGGSGRRMEIITQ
jgi:hypothetical protein